MRRASICTVLLLLASLVLGATVFREQVVMAAKPSASVEVVNTPAQAVPVREQAMLEPVQASVFGSFATGERFSSEEDLYTVPEDKILVVEAFTVMSNMAADDLFKDARLVLEFDGGTFDWIIHPVDEGVSGGTGARIFRGSTLVAGYAGPGTTVVAEALRDGASLSSTAVIFMITGHLVDAP